MPPQGNNSQQVPPSPGPAISVDSIKNNGKLMATIKTFVLYGTIVYVINAIVDMMLSTLHFSYGFAPFSIGVIIAAVIFGIIGFAIGAVIFYFIYDPIHNWVKRTPFLSKYIHDMFTLFWKPYLVVFVIMAVFGLLGMLGLGAAAVATTSGYAAASFGTLFIGWLISLAVQIAVYYWYAKSVSAKLTSYYPW